LVPNEKKDLKSLLGASCMSDKILVGLVLWVKERAAQLDDGLRR
jgi:hypothetical protein